MVAADWNGLSFVLKKKPGFGRAFLLVIPVKVGIHGRAFFLFPENQKGEKQTPWIPASAEMTSNGMA